MIVFIFFKTFSSSNIKLNKKNLLTLCKTAAWISSKYFLFNMKIHLKRNTFWVQHNFFLSEPDNMKIICAGRERKNFLIPKIPLYNLSYDMHTKINLLNLFTNLRLAYLCVVEVLRNTRNHKNFFLSLFAAFIL